MEWARANGCLWDKNTCTCAANQCHLEVLKWARQNGCPWDEETCLNAAMCGHDGIFQWVLENGCPWSRNHGISESAAGSNNPWLVEWARNNGRPPDIMPVEAHGAQNHP